MKLLGRFLFPSLLFLFIAPPAQAEDWPTFDLVSLVWNSPVIFIGKALPEPVRQFGTPPEPFQPRRFRVLKILARDTFALSDTIEVEGFGTRYYLPQLQNGEPMPFDAIAFFGTMHPLESPDTQKMIFTPYMSGVRAFRRDSMFVPFQHEKPGPYIFLDIAMSLDSFMAKIERTQIRINNLLKIRKLRPISIQNNTLRAWISAHATELKNSEYWYDKDSEDNWGEIKFEVFKWFNGPWPDLWRSMVLADSIFGFAVVGHRNLFLNPEARAFLMSELENPKGQHFIAAEVLAQSLWDLELSMFNISREEQKRILQIGVHLLDIPDLARSALTLIEAASFPYELEQQHLRDISTLPDLKLRLKNSPGDLPEWTIEHLVNERLANLIKRMEGR